MFLRLFFSSTLLFCSLYAVPNVEELKQAVKANPELLNTPQAQAEMAKRGITSDDVKEKLNMMGGANSDIAVSAKLIENDIEDNYLENNETNVSTITVDDLNDSTLSERLNPFTFNTNKDLRIELNKKHTKLIQNKLSRYYMKF